MKDFLLKFSDKTIRTCFFLLFFLVPLALTPYNYELFEYNKMMLTYAFTVIIVGSWLIKMVIKKEIIFRRTPLDLPLLLFLLSQVISTFLSIDRHVSLFGYYSRFNGGLISTFSYLTLYYAFVSNFPKDKIIKLLQFSLISGLLVAIYGVLEHFGIDKNLWVQDVQNRVFSTLGQPNWLAAYMAVLIPIIIGNMPAIPKISILKTELMSKTREMIKTGNYAGEKQNLQRPEVSEKFDIEETRGNFSIMYVILGSIFYLTILFTKSRSGFLGLWISLFALFVMVIFFTLQHRKYLFSRSHIQAIALICVIFMVITFFAGAPFEQINRFTWPQITKNREQRTENKREEKPIGSSLLEIGITESGTIRKIVWKGAVDIVKHYPFFGSGVETFAFAYYKFRLQEHNMTSEWDFLYNKAHNEYLNYAATTGFVGLGSYLLIILVFIWWNIKNSIKYHVASSKYKENDKNILTTSYFLLTTGLFTGWLSILITNFFGFSVVIIQLFFYLIPAISFILMNELDNRQPFNIAQGKQITDNNRIFTIQYLLILVISFVICYLLFVLFRMWTADTIFTKGYSESQNQEYMQAYKNIRRSITLNSDEPLYYDEFVVPAGYLSVLTFENKDATLSAQLRDEAILASNEALKISPNNVNFWKTRTRLFFMLSQLDEKYYDDAVDSLERSKFLSPTDPKITYNLALLYDKRDKIAQAIKMLEETIRLKPDYKDAYLALGLFYEKEKKFDQARKEYNFILKYLEPNNTDVKKRLENIKIK